MSLASACLISIRTLHDLMLLDQIMKLTLMGLLSYLAVEFHYPWKNDCPYVCKRIVIIYVAIEMIEDHDYDKIGRLC
jgi:hypothetical protein